MDKSALKKVIKPLIKECLKEILYEEGLTKLVKEDISEKQNYTNNEREFMKKNLEQPKINLKEAKKRLLDQIGMTGFDPFDGSEPLQDDRRQLHEDGAQESRLMAGIQGSGVDISSLMSANKQAWSFFNNALNKGKKE